MILGDRCQWNRSGYTSRPSVRFTIITVTKNTALTYLTPRFICKSFYTYITLRQVVKFVPLFCDASARIPVMVSSFTKLRNNAQTQHTGYDSPDK
jgi:hypothetical protein